MHDKLRKLFNDGKAAAEAKKKIRKEKENKSAAVARNVKLNDTACEFHKSEGKINQRKNSPRVMELGVCQWRLFLTRA